MTATHDAATRRPLPVPRGLYQLACTQSLRQTSQTRYVHVDTSHGVFSPLFSLVAAPAPEGESGACLPPLAIPVAPSLLLRPSLRLVAMPSAKRARRASAAAAAAASDSDSDAARGGGAVAAAPSAEALASIGMSAAAFAALDPVERRTQKRLIRNRSSAANTRQGALCAMRR